MPIKVTSLVFFLPQEKITMNIEKIKEKIAVIFDNGGETIDRFTILFKDGDCFGSSHYPQHPQGFGQFCGNLNTDGFRDTVESFKERTDMGKQIQFEDLNEEVQKYIAELLADDEDD